MKKLISNLNILKLNIYLLDKLEIISSIANLESKTLWGALRGKDFNFKE